MGRPRRESLVPLRVLGSQQEFANTMRRLQRFAKKQDKVGGNESINRAEGQEETTESNSCNDSPNAGGSEASECTERYYNQLKRNESNVQEMPVAIQSTQSSIFSDPDSTEQNADFVPDPNVPSDSTRRRERCVENMVGRKRSPLVPSHSSGDAT